MSAVKSYSAKDIKQLQGLDHVRHRVGMYLGSSGDDGLTTAYREILDNAVDEAIAGHGSDIVLRFFADGSAEVEDHGRGLPVDSNEEGISGITLTVGTIGSGGKFNADNYKVSGGLNGVGSAATNATSVRFDVVVYRDGKKHELSFKEGKPGHFAKPNDPRSTFKPGDVIRISKDDRPAAARKASPTGTTIRFWPDFSVFMPDAKFLVDDIKFRAKSTAFLVPNLSITVEDYRAGTEDPQVDVFHFTGGLLDMLPTLTHHPLVVNPIHIVTEGSFAETRNVLQSDGTTARQEVTRAVDIDVAFAYTNVEDTVLRSYVNIIGTKLGGTHESGLWRALSRVLTNYIKNTKGFLKAKEEPPTLEDVRDGFVGVVSIKFPEPTFSGQAKESLSTQQITSVVSQSVGAELQKWLNNKKNARQVKILCQKIVEASRIRLAAKQQKEVARKKTALETAASMPSKLVDCSEVNSPYSELHIAEGDSALGTMKAARDSRYQALLPIRGKILNVQKSSMKQMIDNAEIAAIIQVMGAGSGKNFDLEQARYHNVCIAVDADVDGAHIRSLLITLFYKLMRPMIEAGRLYATQPPLYVIKTKGRNAKVYYAQSDQERDSILKRLDKAGTKYEPLQRLKGLGEMDADEFWDTTLNPETRTLRRVTIEDAELAEDMLELAMGNKVEPRKEWIMESRSKLSEDDLDI